MKTPLLLMASALLYWGWQVDLLVVAILMALALEGSRWLTMRWQFSDKDYRRIMDLCVYLSVGCIAFSVLTGMDHESAMGMFGWMPLLVFPLMLAQAYGTEETINFSALSLIARNRAKQEQLEHKEKTKGGRVNISYIYLALCLLSSGIGNHRSPWFYLALFILVAWALWAGRNPAWPTWLWLTLLIVIGVSGFGAQIGLQDLQDIVEEKTINLMVGGGQGQADPFKTRTAIGSIGSLKLSDEIIFRISTEQDKQPPGYLRNGCYNVYKGATWYSSPRKFDPVKPGADKKSWQIHPAPDDGREVEITISARLQGGEGVLPVPIGATSLSDLPVEAVGLGRLGAVQLTGSSGLLHTQMRATPSKEQDSIFTNLDLFVADRLRPMLETVMQKNGLNRGSPDETQQAIKQFFRDQFSYSLALKEEEQQDNGLENFLSKTRSGHCEFFATATVLLARIAGIPARYATGWVVEEYSDREQCYLIRSRHAHAWAMLYLDDQWQLLDTTPANWLAQENEEASFLTPVRDFFSWCWYRFSVWRDRGKQGIPNAAYWLAVPILLLLAWSFVRRRKKKQAPQATREPEKVIEKLGIDSDFFQIELHLAEAGYGRRTGETPQQWLQRLDHAQGVDFDIRQLHDILRLHYSYRFDPDCDKHYKQELDQRVGEWLAGFISRSRQERDCH